MLILVRDDEASDWRPLVEVPPEDAETTGPLGFTKDGNEHVPADVRRLEHRPTGEDEHRDAARSR